MEVVVSLAIGVLGGSGVWLLLRPRTFQVLIGLSLLSYAVNLFIFSMGSLSIREEPIVAAGRRRRPAALHRPDAAGAGADRDRHRLRDDGAVPGRAARLARPERQRPRRRRRGAAVSGLEQYVLYALLLVRVRIARAGENQSCCGVDRRREKKSPNPW